MPGGSNHAGRSWRFSKSALFLSASALCLPSAPNAALAGPLDNTPFVSMYGGYLFNESDPNINFTSVLGDDFLAGIRPLHPGDDGVSAGIEFGGPLGSSWDWLTSLNAAHFLDDEADDDGPNGATAENGFDLQYLDVELGYRPGMVGDGIALRLFGGARLLHASNDIDHALDGVSKVGTYEHDIELWGVGPRAGLEAELPLGSSKASLSFLGAGSAIFSESDHEYTFDFDSGSAVAGSDSSSDTRTVYNLEGRVALGYAMTDRLQFELGYQAQQWWNLTTTTNDVLSGDETIFDEGEGDFLDHGPFARLTVKLGGEKP